MLVVVPLGPLVPVVSGAEVSGSDTVQVVVAGVASTVAGEVDRAHREGVRAGSQPGEGHRRGARGERRTVERALEGARLVGGERQRRGRRGRRPGRRLGERRDGCHGGGDGPLPLGPLHLHVARGVGRPDREDVVAHGETGVGLRRGAADLDAVEPAGERRPGLVGGERERRRRVLGEVGRPGRDGRLGRPVDGPGWLAGVGSMFPAASTARTSRTCSPSVTAVSSSGLVQADEGGRVEPALEAGTGVGRARRRTSPSSRWSPQAARSRWPSPAARCRPGRP